MATAGPQADSGNTDKESERGETLLELAVVLLKHKKLILGLPVLVAVIATAILLLIPNWYTATAKLLPPQQSQTNAVAILGQLGALTGGASQALGIKNPSDIFVAMLKSRTVADAIIDRFHLKEKYDEKYYEYARRELASNVEISAGRDAVITIAVDDKSPIQAAEMANAYIEELEKLTRKLAVGEAGQRRLFFETQLKQAKEDLTQAEVLLAKFQVDKKILNPQGQASLAISAAAGLQAQIAAKEVQIAALKSFATEANPDFLRVQEELVGLRAQLAKVGRSGDRSGGDVLLSIGNAPEQAVQYLRKFRDVKYYETLYELLARQYEIARMDEAKDATLIQVLDHAIPPDRKSKPKRVLIVVLLFLTAIMVAVTSAFIMENWSRGGQRRSTSRRWEELQKHRKWNAYE